MSKYLDYEGLKQYNDKILEKIGETTVVIEPTDSKISLEDYAKIEKADNVLLKYNDLIYRKCARVNVDDVIQFECIYEDYLKIGLFLSETWMTTADQTNSVISVSDTSKYKVGMRIYFLLYTGGIPASSINGSVVTEIDSTNKKIKVDPMPEYGQVGDDQGDGFFAVTYTNDTSIKLTEVWVTEEDEANKVVSVADWRSLVRAPEGCYLDFRTPSGGRLAGGIDRRVASIDRTNSKITMQDIVFDCDTLV